MHGEDSKKSKTENFETQKNPREGQNLSYKLSLVDRLG